MAVVHIPAHWREHTEGRATVEVRGRNLRAVIRDLTDQYPAMQDLLLDGDRIRGEIAIAIDAVVTENNPLEAVPEDAEVHLVPAISGGVI